MLSAGVRALAWSADGRHLADASAGPMIRVRDVVSGEVLQTWVESSANREECALVFAPNGSLYAHFAKQVVRYTDSERTKLFGYKGAASSPPGLQLSHDGSLLLTGDGHGMDLTTGRRLPVAEPPNWTVDDIRFAGCALAPSGDVRAVAWDIEDCRQHKLALAIVDSRSAAHLYWLTQGELAPPDQLRFSSDSRKIQVIHREPAQMRVTSLALNSSAQSQVTAAITQSHRLPLHGEPLPLAQAGSRLFLCSGSVLDVYDDLRHIEQIPLRLSSATCVSASPDGATVAIGNRDGQIEIFAI